jgi:hypothetical protein
VISNYNSESLLITSPGTSGAWNIYSNVWEAQVGVGSPRCIEFQTDAGPVTFNNNDLINLNFAEPVRIYSGTVTGGASNNIVFGVAGGQSIDLPHDYNLYSGSTSETHGIGSATTNIFVNFPAGNYHLAAGSPAIGAGFGGVDIGAYDPPVQAVGKPSPPNGLSVIVP